MATGNDRNEFANPAAQRALTRRLLLRQLRYVMRRSPYYRAQWTGRRLPSSPDGAVRFLRSLPVTTRDELEARNEDFRCGTLRDVAEVVATSGTTGAPLRIWLTARDLDRLARVEASSFAMAGLGPGDAVQLCVTMDNLFMAGQAYYLGLRRAGCAVLRQGPANPARQLELLRLNRVAGVMTVPSFLNALGEERERQGLPAAAFPLRAAVLVGESLRCEDLSPSPLAQRIGERWPGVALYGNFGNTEMNGSFAECAEGQGYHVDPRLFYVEILDEGNRPCPPGKPGLVTVTPLGVTGTPLVRYRTGDISFLLGRRCRCGRTSPRMGPVLSREAQMLKVKGTKLYPSAIHHAVMLLREIEDHAVIAGRDRHGSDSVEVVYAVREGAALPERALREHLFARLKMHPAVRQLPRDDLRALTFPPGYRKKRAFIDRREPAR